MNDEIRTIIDKYDFFNTLGEYKIVSIKTKKESEKTFCLIDESNNYYTLRINTDKYITVDKYARVINELSKYKKSWVPKIIYYSTDKKVLVTDYPGNGNGISLDKIDDYSNIDISDCASQLNVLVNDMHSIKSEIIDFKHDVKHSNWWDYFYNYFMNDVNTALDITFISLNQKENIDNILKHFKQYFLDIEPVCLHGDLKRDNICYNLKTKEIYIIDFESVKFGDPLFDIARFSRIKTPIAKRFKEMFYSDIEENPIYSIYELQTLIRWYVIDFTKHGNKPQTPINDVPKIIDLLSDKYL